MKQQTQTNKIEFREVELKDLIEDMHQGINTVTEKVNYCENGYPIIQSKHITGGSLDLSDARFLDKEDFDFYKDKYHPKKGDILICNIGTIGKSIVIGDKNDFLIAWNLFLIKLQKDKISPNFFKFYLDELYSKKLFDKMLSGGTVKFINKSKIGSIGVPLPFLNNKPDLKEQERIVKILEKAEKVKERGKNAENLLDEYLKSVFYEMFYNKGFEEVELGNKEFFDVQSGGTPLRVKKEYWGGEIPWIGSTACKDLSLYKSEQFITKKGLENSSAKLFSKDTILIALVGATIGKTALLKFDCATNQNIAGIIIKDNKRVNSNYLFFSAKQLYPKFMSLSGDTFKMATLSFIRSIKIPLPPIHLQQKFAKIAEQVEKMKENIKKTKQNSEELFNSLMQKAFRGEIL